LIRRIVDYFVSHTEYSVKEVLLYYAIAELPVTLSRSEGSLSALNERFFASLRMTNVLAKTLSNFLYGVMSHPELKVGAVRDRR
jgi:hypothetical protein